MMRSSKFPIGTKFIRYSRAEEQVETIVDIYTTRNNAGDVVKVRYVATHEFLGQEVADYDIPEATIARSEIVEEETA